MQKTEIIKLLKTFSPEEIMAFKKFVTRKEYNKKRLSKELLAYIYLSKPNFEGEALNDENALTFLKPQKDDIDEGYLRQMRSILSQYAQDFLVENEFQKRTFYRSHLLAEVLNEKGFTKKAKKILLAQSKKEEKEKQGDRKKIRRSSRRKRRRSRWRRTRNKEE